jgi:hypothetical protein
MPPKPEKTLATRFSDKTDGFRRVCQALAAQPTVAGDKALAAVLAKAAVVSRYAPGDELMVQGAEDHHIEFILAGDVDILIHGNRVSGRQAGTHVVSPARTRVVDEARGMTQTPVRDRGSLSSTTAVVPRQAAAAR